MAGGAHDLDWLKGALQSAIALEHSTLPLYVAAMFSLRTQSFTAYNSVRSVAMEEMVHLAIACNTLSALGGAPQIRHLDPGFPSQGLPGGAEPDLSAWLAQLSRPQLQAFMRIELPEFLMPDEYRHESYPTIASLYDAIDAAIDANADAVREAMKETAGSPDRANQVGDNIGFKTIEYVEGEDPIPQLHAGIDEILEQGEGASSRTLHANPGSEGEESHYCKFAELYYGARYEEPSPPVELTLATEPEFFRGYAIPFPDVVNTLAVPSDGYAAILAEDPNAQAAEQALEAFDTAYSTVLAHLDAVWNGPAAQAFPTLGAAVGAMAGLRVPACFKVMVQEVPAPAIAKLPELYPDEHERMAELTDLDRPVFYGPRFRNLNPAA
ncbi:MAG TPA: ferritin-like protein [Thermoleophilaceae bacterium]